MPGLRKQKDWSALSQKEQDTLLAQDEVVRKTGAYVAAVQPEVTTVCAWDGNPVSTENAFADSKVPLAGFSIIEAESIEEVVKLVSGTPCARAKSAIEIRPIMMSN